MTDVWISMGDKNKKKLNILKTLLSINKIIDNAQKM